MAMKARIKKWKYFKIPGYSAINLFGVIFAKNPDTISKYSINHELIHTEQMKELFYIPFYILYGLEYMVKSIKYLNFKKAYYSVGFEREAYDNMKNLNYIEHRKNKYFNNKK